MCNIPPLGVLLKSFRVQVWVSVGWRTIRRMIHHGKVRDKLQLGHLRGIFPRVHRVNIHEDPSASLEINKVLHHLDTYPHTSPTVKSTPFIHRSHLFKKDIMIHDDEVDDQNVHTAHHSHSQEFNLLFFSRPHPQNASHDLRTITFYR